MKLLRTSLLIVSCLVGLALTVTGAAIVWFLFNFSPLTDADIVRDDAPSTVAVIFQVIPCGDGTPHMRLPPDAGDTVGPGLEIAVPPGLPHPEEREDIGVSGNRFILTGYLSRFKTDDKPFRIDLISWEILAPYDVWVRLENGDVITKLQNTPIRFVAPTPLPQHAFSMPFKYYGC